MSKRTEKIEALRGVFEKAKHAPRDEEGGLDDLDLHGDLQNALWDVGNKKFFELKDEVYYFLQDPYPEFREIAVSVLGSCNYLQLDEFREVAYEIWLNDTNKDVKVVALDSWAGYYRDTKDPIILKYLYNVLRSDKYSVRIRVYAFYHLIVVADAIAYPGEHSDILELTELEDNKALTKAMDWGKINRIMQQYVPGWKKEV